MTCFGCSPRVSHKPKFSVLSWWTINTEEAEEHQKHGCNVKPFLSSNRILTRGSLELLCCKITIWRSKYYQQKSKARERQNISGQKSLGSTGGWVSLYIFTGIQSLFIWFYGLPPHLLPLTSVFLLWDVSIRYTPQGTHPSVGPLSPQSKTLTRSD